MARGLPPPDLDDDKIQYVHGGENNTSDSFVFTVADGVPNELNDQLFEITINAVDDDPDPTSPHPSPQDGSSK